MKIVIFILTGLVIISCTEESKEAEPRIRADFTWKIDNTNLYTIDFTNVSENAIRFSWDFGNGDFSNLESPTYTYDSGGDFDVTLAVFGPSGNTDYKTRGIVLYHLPEPSLLSGRESKTWKLYREGAAAVLSTDSSHLNTWWSGFYNDGSRSCLYEHEFTFYADNTYKFEDHNGFWRDFQVWSSEDPLFESCFEPSTDNMVVNETDLTAWLSGTHSFEKINDEMIILKGKGAWIGFPFLGSTSNHGTNLPDSIVFSYNIKQTSSFDLLTVNFDHGEGGFWTFRYVNYDDWNEEPPLIE
jgi:hypothetical protein